MFQKVIKTAWEEEEEHGERCGLMADGREGTRMGPLSKESETERPECAKVLAERSFPCSRRSKSSKEV